MIITPDGKTIVTKQVATVKPSVAKSVTAGPTVINTAKLAVAKPAVAKSAVAKPSTVDVLAKPSKPKTKIIIRKVISSEEVSYRNSNIEYHLPRDFVIAKGFLTSLPLYTNQI